jgi:hypothetical protein
VNQVPRSRRRRSLAFTPDKDGGDHQYGLPGFRVTAPARQRQDPGIAHRGLGRSARLSRPRGGGFRRLRRAPTATPTASRSAFTVPFTREQVELDYAEIPMTEQIPDGARLLGEVVRYEERVVVAKRVVAVERVRLVRRFITAEQVVGGQVRREVVDLDRTGTPGPTRTGTP